MSLHVAIAGMTSTQRFLYTGLKRPDSGEGMKAVREFYERQSLQRQSDPTLDWMDETSPNNLRDVHGLYCPEEPALEKSVRDVFLTGNMGAVRKDFQMLMNYCAADVKATLNVFCQVFPQFCERLPHPASLGGMLLMGTAYLPVNKNWQKYINAANEAYEKKNDEIKDSLMDLADATLAYAENERYKNDVWLWNLNWKPRNVRLVDDSETIEGDVIEEIVLKKRKVRVVKRPNWYAAMCPIQREFDVSAGMLPGKPVKISLQMQATPKLMRMTWKGYPLHYDDELKWGYLVPSGDVMTPEESALAKELNKQEAEASQEENTDNINEKSKKLTWKEERALLQFPLASFQEYCKNLKTDQAPADDAETPAAPAHSSGDLERKLHELSKELESVMDLESYLLIKNEVSAVKRRIMSKRQKPLLAAKFNVNKHRESTGKPLFESVTYYQLPHKDGRGSPVGNPFSYDFQAYIENGTLRSGSDLLLSDLLKVNKLTSYWKKSKKRIEEQMVVMKEGGETGAILPRIVTAGTVTRRAVEGTWLTASNAYPDRVGSELKAMIQAPQGHCFVGADVDSQELWIAAVLGDSHFGGVHGCTAFGWMTLQGTKKDATDFHSRTAQVAGITRDQAKVFNYSRIYGAGEKFAVELLRQFNPALSREEAFKKASKLYRYTKGKRKYTYTSTSDDEQGSQSTDRWSGGTESAMFNRLESIARSSEPRTPALGARISRALQPDKVGNDFITSRINWIVQSSGVDYLHVILVSMAWLFNKFNISGRFSISIHDEVRYLVREDDKYRAALALQIANLWTRALFAHQLGMHDLPQSVAFFSAVDIDSCLRKEPHLDCVTPSNPLGLQRGYDIAPGQALSVHEILEKTGGSLRPTSIELEKASDSE